MKKLIWLLLLVGTAFGQQYNSDIIPASPGLNLGHTNQRWNVFAKNVNITGPCFINGVPCGTGNSAALVLQTNGVANTVQTLLNFVNTPACNWTNTGGGTTVSCAGGGALCIATASTLSSACGTVKGTLATIVDGNSTQDCTAGGGTNVVTCQYSGVVWQYTGQATNCTSPNCVSSFNTRTGSVTLTANDVGNLTATQSTGSTSGWLCLVTATCTFSNVSTTGALLRFFPGTSTGNELLLEDITGSNPRNTLQAGGTGGVNGWQLQTFAGTGTNQAWTPTDVIFTQNATPIADFNTSTALFSVPVNFGSSFELGGSFGVAGYVATTDGVSGVTWQPPPGAITVTGTANQINVTGGSSPVISDASPKVLPGELQSTQAANGDSVITATAASGATTGNFLLGRNNALSQIFKIDINGNGSLLSLSTTGTNAGMTGWTQGPDNSSNCNANTHCHQAPTGIATTWTTTDAGAIPAATAVEVHTPSGAVDTISNVPTTGSSPTFVQTAVSSAQGAANNTLACFDGSGNTKSCGVPLASIQQTCASASITQSVKCGSLSSTGNTGNIASTNILSGNAAAGDYVISVYLNGTTSGCGTVGSGQMSAQISYTDSNGAVSNFPVVVLSFATTLPNHTSNVISFHNQSLVTTINVRGVYTACSVGTETVDANFVLTRIN